LVQSAQTQKVNPQDQRFLDAAEGWLGLGNPIEANEEIERITPEMRAHPDVLCVRWQIYAAAKKWEQAAEIAKIISEILPDVPFGCIHMAYALHELKRTDEARAVLLPIVGKFEGNKTIPYNLACYECQLGNLKEARGWLEKAIELAGDNDVRMTALKDPDLEPLWENLGQT
jgi:tetratricopeptide (TPR) repeat protein